MKEVDAMMDRSTQKELMESLRGLAGLFQQIDWQDQEQVQIVEDILATVNQSCKQSLSKGHYAFYEDTLRTLEQIIATTDWLHLRTAERETCCQLCQDVAMGLIKVLANEKEIKKEIVFLPYKASMWDSLESVWQAAYDDKEHCNAYVVPIPYCDRNPDMTAAEWHCEADQFPDYVPVLDWHDYTYEKLKEMHPDVIFFHNPYDNYNAVTSVDMQYYSRNLKYCTDKLVYIPYFVMGDTISAHFCQTQGVINADYVIVQDENIKEQYERYYPGGNCPEGKILALGSPKFDKVLNSRKEDFDLPESWKRIIDGKKVILYNTSLTAALENTDRLCTKLRSVLNTFKGREDVALWWRPHPLMDSTLRSMRPEYYKEYKKLETIYIQEGWGICDKSANLNRAIAYSDLYYGDQSSVIWLYRETGKPICIEHMYSSQEECYFTTIYIWLEKDEVWFVASGTGTTSLFRYDMKKNKTEYCGSTGRLASSEYDYCVLAKVKDKVVIAPYVAPENFLIYDLSRKQFFDIAIPNCYYSLLKSENTKFIDVIKYRDRLYFFAWGVPLVAMFDSIEQKMNYYEFFDDLQDIKWEIGSGGVVCIDNHAYIVLMNSNIVMNLNLDTMKMELAKTPVDIDGAYINYDYLKRRFYVVSSSTGDVLSWDNEQDVKYYPKVDTISTKDNILFQKTVIMRDRILLLPYNSDSYEEINLKCDSKKKYVSYGDCYTSVQYNGEKNVAFNHKNGSLLIAEYDGKIYSLKVPYDRYSFFDGIKDDNEKSMMFYENYNEIDWKGFENINRTRFRTKTDYGTTIYKYIVQ